MQEKDNIIFLAAKNHKKTDEAGSFLYPQYYNTRTKRFISEATKFLIAYHSGSRLKQIEDYGRENYGTRYPEIKHRERALSTVDGVGNKLAVFLRWCERSGRKAKNYDRYSPHVIHGPSSLSKNPLFASVGDFQKELSLKLDGVDDLINRYVYDCVNVAQDYCKFLSSIGLRTNNDVYRIHVFKKPDKGLRKKDGNYRVPLPSELSEWCKSFKRSTETRLMVSLIVFGGLRSEDVRKLKVTDIPSPEDRVPTHDTDNVFNRFDFEIKDSKGGKTRTTSLPDHVWSELDQYLHKNEKFGIRIKKLKNLSKKMGKKLDTKLLFFSDHKIVDGVVQPWDQRKLTYAFSKSNFGDRWTPHMGRHAFAITRLAELIVQEKRSGRGNDEQALLRETVLQVNYLSELQNEMGHADSKTTQEVYLQWARGRTALMEDIFNELLRRK